MFFLSAAIYMVGNLVFVLFGTSRVQKWNDQVESRRDSGVRKISMAPITIETKQEKDVGRIP